MTYNYQIQTFIKQKCMYINVRVYLLHAYMHGSRNFRQGGGRSEPQLVEKSTDNLLVLNLYFTGGSDVYFKETIIFPESKQGGGGSKMSGVSKVMGPNCFFL